MKPLTGNTPSLREERLNLVMAIKNEGIWDWDLKTNVVLFDDRYYTMSGYEPGDFPPRLEEFQSRIHPDDVDYVMTTASRHLSGEIDIFLVEFRFLMKSGSWMWIKGQGKIVEFSNNGEPLRFVGTHSDITELKNTEMALKQSEEKFRKLFKDHSAVKLIIDPEQGNIVDANDAAVRFYGYETNQLCKMKIAQINTSTPEEIKQAIRNVRELKKTQFEFKHRKADGTIVDVEIFSSKIEVGGRTFLHSIIHDISEKKKTFADLIAAKEKAEESDRLKTAFLNNISHEIRTPMNAIIGFAELLSEPESDVLPRDFIINTINYSGRHLLDIINDIIEISNIEAGISTCSKERIEVNKLLQQIYQQFSLQADSQKLILKQSLALSDKKAVIISDETKLIQVITNLLTNAFKFTPQGTIEFGYRSRNEKLEFFVSDSGIGISPEQINRIFERFYQVDHGLSRIPQGTGLGLSIAKSYVELLGGRIWAESAPEKGSTFIFTLPVNS